jgi:hypothetical protein
MYRICHFGEEVCVTEGITDTSDTAVYKIKKALVPEPPPTACVSGAEYMVHLPGHLQTPTGLNHGSLSGL